MTFSTKPLTPIPFGIAFSLKVGFPGGLVVKNPPANAGDIRGSIPGLGKSPGGGNGNPLQDSCLENSIDRGAWRAPAHGVAESDMTEHARVHPPKGN